MNSTNWADMSLHYSELCDQEERHLRWRNDFLKEWAEKIIRSRYKRFKMTPEKLAAFIESLYRDMCSEDLIRKDIIDKIVLYRTQAADYATRAHLLGHQVSGALFDN